MSAQLKFARVLDFSALPKDWTVSRVAVDWNGSPLVLVEEGKPPYASVSTSTDARMAWLNTPPKVRHLIYWQGLSQRTVRFEKSTGVLTLHVQPFGEGWLLGEVRGGRADVYDDEGRPLRTLDLGDASKDVQTTPRGNIWVSYFDEGVYGGGIGAHGVVCFDSVGRPIFKYSEFAEQNQLPFIDDCYAMNVVDDDEMWLSYYSDFPLISVKNFQLAHRFNEFGCMSRAFAILGESAVFPKCYTPSEEQSQLLRRQFSDTGQSEKLEAVDETGTPIGGKFTAAARGSHFYLFNKTALYKLTTDL